MDNKDIAGLLYPDVNIDIEDIFKRYPKRKLKEGQLLQDSHQVLLDLCT